MEDTHTEVKPNEKEVTISVGETNEKSEPEIDTPDENSDVSIDIDEDDPTEVEDQPRRSIRTPEPTF